MEIRIDSVAFAGTLCRTRIPFRFGRVTLTEAPVLLARVTVVADGREAVGHAGEQHRRLGQRDPTEAEGKARAAERSGERHRRDADLQAGPSLDI